MATTPRRRLALAAALASCAGVGAALIPAIPAFAAVVTPGVALVSPAAGSEAAGNAQVQVVYTGVGGGDTLAGPVTVTVALASGTATAGVDFPAANISATFPEATICNLVTTCFINVPITDDLIYDPAETFTVTIASVSGGIVAAPPANSSTVTIADNDTRYKLIIGSSPTDCVGGTVNMTEAAAASNFYANFCNNDGSNTMPATAADNVGVIPNIDVVGIPVGADPAEAADLSTGFGAQPVVGPFVVGGPASIPVPVTALLDNRIEVDEWFRVWLTPGATALSTSYGPPSNQSFGHIAASDGDKALVLLTPASTLTGPEGTAFGVNVQVIPTGGATLEELQVPVNTVNGTATSPSDFAGRSGATAVVCVGTVAGCAANPVNVTSGLAAIVDAIPEPTETFQVAFGTSTPTAASLGSPLTFTITGDPNINSLSLQDLSDTEGNAGTKTFPVKASLATPATQAITVNYSIVGGTATAGTDFVGGSGSITIPVGATDGVIPVQVLGDTAVEPDETLTVVVTSVTVGGLPAPQVTVAKGTATVTIQNDDGTPPPSGPTVNVLPGSVREPKKVGGKATLPFTITLSSAQAVPVTVTYATNALGSATAGVDFIPTSGSVTIPAGATSIVVTTVKVLGDKAVEGPETVGFAVLSASGAGATPGATSTGLGTIIDRQSPVRGIF